jgi:hypothetical protein
MISKVLVLEVHFGMKTSVIDCLNGHISYRTNECCIMLSYYRELMKAGNGVEDAYWQMVVKDIQDALDLFLPIYEESEGDDGYVSVEVSPSLAHDTQGTVEAAKWLHKSVNRANVYIKIPATEMVILKTRLEETGGILSCQ